MMEEAEEVFITNSLMRIMPVRAIDDKTYAVGTVTLTAELMNHLLKVVSHD